MKKITPFLWFEKDIQAVISYYLSLFPNVTNSAIREMGGTPSGVVHSTTLSIYGQNFDIMTAGPYLSFKPTVSFIILCDSADEANALWNAFLPTSKVLMEKNSYPFADVYGWMQDAYGVSWQIFYKAGERNSVDNLEPKIIPTLMFAGDACGRAEEAINFYTTHFKNSKTNYVIKYGDVPTGEVIETNAVINHAAIVIEGFGLALFDSGKKSPLSFDQAISFIVDCENQEEIDYYWDALTKDGGKEVQCGWLNDKFGVPWQIVPKQLQELMSKGTAEQTARVVSAFMQMKKFDIKKLEEAFEEK